MFMKAKVRGSSPNSTNRADSQAPRQSDKIRNRRKARLCRTPEPGTDFSILFCDPKKDDVFGQLDISGKQSDSIAELMSRLYPAPMSFEASLEQFVQVAILKHCNQLRDDYARSMDCLTELENAVDQSNGSADLLFCAMEQASKTETLFGEKQLDNFSSVYRAAEERLSRAFKLVHAYARGWPGLPA
jgi:hypothetical protein